MRLLFVSNLYPPYWVGGYEQIASWLAKGLEKRGHEVAVLTGRGAAFDGQKGLHAALDLDLAAFTDRYFTTGLPENGLLSRVRHHVFSRPNWRAAKTVLRAFRPDVVSFWNPAFITFSPLAAARFAGVPAVAHLSDTTANVFRNPHPPSFPAPLRPLARAAVDATLRAARPARFVVPSEFLKRKLVAREGLPASRTDVLHWPIEPSASSAAIAPRSGGARVLFVGTLIPEKGVGVLIEALRLALPRSPDLVLTLVGDGHRSYVDAMREKARGLPVVFSGRLDRAQVMEAYERHDILAFPSIWDEPFAVVPLEAMAMGLTVVATTAGGTPEAVEDGRTGLLVAPDDAAALAAALARVASDRETARRLAAAGQTEVRARHAFPSFLERVEQLYSAVAAGGAS